MVKVDSSVLFPAALALLVLSCALSDARPHRHNHYKKMFEQHMSNVYSFGCREPQLRLVQLKDLGIAVRCDCATGYCPNPDEVCSANVTAAVELVFRITNQVEGSGQEYKTVSATEHISCSCQPIINQIK